MTKVLSLSYRLYALYLSTPTAQPLSFPLIQPAHGRSSHHTSTLISPRPIQPPSTISPLETPPFLTYYPPTIPSSPTNHPPNMDPSLTPDSPRISVTQLALTNFNYWYTKLIRVASINNYGGHLDTNPPVFTGPTDIRPFTRQKWLALALIFHSLSEEVRALLSDDDFLLPPHDLCNRLHEITTTNPINAPYLLSSLAREATLHSGTPMHEYCGIIPLRPGLGGEAEATAREHAARRNARLQPFGRARE